MPLLTPVPAHLEQRDGGSRQPRHIHAGANAALVLSGGYEESGTWGRFCVRACDVLLHDTFDAHLNRIEPLGAITRNLLKGGRLGNGVYCVNESIFDTYAASPLNGYM